MQFNQHGIYALHWQGDVLIQTSGGTWNDICSKNLHRDARLLLANNERPRWGLFCDLRKWDGTTPEAAEIWFEFFETCVERGMVIVAVLMPSTIHAKAVDYINKRCNQLVPTILVQTEDEAYALIAASGIQIS